MGTWGKASFKKCHRGMERRLSGDESVPHLHQVPRAHAGCLTTTHHLDRLDRSLQAWQLIPCLRQDCYKFETNLGYTVSSRLVQATD